MRILVVEDEKNLRDVIVKQLLDERYAVDGCGRGDDALDYLRAAEYDAIVLDILMPGMSGLDVLKRLRQKGDATPVLLLTALGSVDDRVNGLNAGADDYLVKPFAIDELKARLRAMLRRAAGQAVDTLTVADLTLDTRARTCARGGTAIELTGKEFDILEALCRNRGAVLSRETILQHVWNYDYAGGSNVIDVYIRYLRKKIDDPFPKKLIHTIRGVGYTVREDA